MGMKRWAPTALAAMVAMLAIVGPTIASAQTAVRPSIAPITAPIDPAKLKLAQSIVMNMMSDEQINTMFAGVRDMMSSRMISGFMPADQLAKARASDPYFDERMKRVGAVTADYMKEIMADLGPDLRGLVARSLARRESLSDLQEQAAFFATPAGRHLFDSYYQLMSDPDYMSVLSGLAQRIAAHAGDLEARMAKAMADLPPPPKPGTVDQPHSPPK